MSGTPFTCCSIGAATVRATTSALAPGYWAVTCTVGGVISGYCSIGRRHSEMAPMRIVITAITFAKIGRSMKNLENIVKGCHAEVSRGVRLQVHTTDPSDDLGVTIS